HAWQTASADIAELNDIIELANQVQEQLLASKLEGAPGRGGAAPKLRPRPDGAQSPLGSGCGAAMRRPNGFDDPEPPKLMEPVAGTSSCSSGPALRSSSVPAHGSRFLGAEGAHRWTSVAPTSSTMCWSGGPLGPMAVSVAALPYAACTDCYSVLSTSPPLPPASEEVDARLAALEARQYGASASEVPGNVRHDSQELLQSARRLALEADVDRLRRELCDARADRARLLQVEASEATAAEAAAEVSNAEAARSLREAQSEADGLKAALRRKQSELDAHLEREKGETQRQRSEAQELRVARDAALHAREEMSRKHEAVVEETAELRAAVQFQAQEASKVREAVEHLCAERSELEGRHASAQRDLEQLQKLKISEQSALAELARLRQEADDLLQERQQLQQSERRVCLDSEQRLKSMEDLQGRTCEEMESIQHEAAVVQQENRRLAAKVEASQAAFQELEQQLRTAEAAELAKAKKLKEELRQGRTERETLTVELEFERTRRESLTVDLKSVQAKLAVSEAEIAKLEKQRDELASDVGHLRNAQAQREEAETSLRAALKEAKIVNLELEQVLAEKEEALSRARLQANGLAFQERRVDYVASSSSISVNAVLVLPTGGKFDFTTNWVSCLQVFVCAPQGKGVTVWGLFQPQSHVKTALAGAGGGAGPGPVGVTLALLASSATWWRNPPEAMSDNSDASELTPEAVDSIEPDRFGLQWQGVIEGGVASPGRGVTGGRAITLDPDTVRTHPLRLFERLNGTEGKVHLCRSLPCTRLHLSSDTGNYRSPLVHATAFARCPESDPASQLDLGAVWTECRTSAPTPALLDASIETDLPPVTVAVAGAAPEVEAQGSGPVVVTEVTNGRRRHMAKSPQLETEFSMKAGETLEQDRPPTPRMSWFLDHTFDTTAAQAWYSKVAAKLKWTSQIPQGDHDSQIIRHLSAPKVAFSVLAVVCLVAYSSLFPGPVPGGVLGSALYHAAKAAVVVASWVWYLGATFVRPVMSSLVIGSVGAWCAMSSGIVAAFSVGSAVFANVFSRAASAAGQAFGSAAGSASGGAGASSSPGSVPPSGSAGGQAPGGARPGIATTPEPAPVGGGCPCGAPSVKWSTEAGRQQLAQWCAAKSTESLPLLRVDAEQFVPPSGCRPVKEYLLPGSPTVGMICMKHVMSSLRTQDTLPEWVSRVKASVRDATSLQAACDGAEGRPGLEGIVAELADEWNMRLAAAWERVASQCPHEWVLQLASRFGDTPVPRSDAPAPSPLLRSEAPVWSPFAGPEKHSGIGLCGPESQPPPASHDLTSRSMFHGSVVPQDDAPQHPRLASMMGLYGSGTVPLGPQDHSWNPVPQAGSMPPSRQMWGPYRDPNGLASLGGGSVYHSPPTANRGMSSNPMMSGTPVMTGGLASFGIHPGGVALHGPTPWPQGQMGSSQSPPWFPGPSQNPHDPVHGLASAIGSLQLVLSKGNEDVVRQLERSNRKDEARGGDRHTIAGITREDELLKFALGGCDTQPIALCPGETGKMLIPCTWYAREFPAFPSLDATQRLAGHLRGFSDMAVFLNGLRPATRFDILKLGLKCLRYRNCVHFFPAGLATPTRAPSVGSVRPSDRTAPLLVPGPPKVFDLEDPEGHFRGDPMPGCREMCIKLCGRTPTSLVILSRGLGLAETLPSLRVPR
ncbi:unnamed protein product, partial [Polarella glacialis]